MRSRSHRLPVTEPRHDDWVDESWTVDCVCGVTFDDGEEMVDCDECGVWVHTRCSRYVKSEKSFACDKCKSKSSGGGGSSAARNESEETEVAEFLVELPTKTLRMENPNPPAEASRRPFRLWTENPLEERVHVQGVPGGEPALFSGAGMSSVFGPQLWKSSGYVPKKFNLRYTEFPFLGKADEKEEEELDAINGEKNASNGARVLFSLLKKNEGSVPAPVVDSVRVKGVVEGRASHEIVPPRQKRTFDGEKHHSTSEDGIKKKNNSVTVVFHSGKRKKEEFGLSKVQNVKKKVRSSEKEGDVKRRALHAMKAASTLSSDAKQLDFSQDRGCKAVSDDLQHGKNGSDKSLDRPGECATNLASNENGIEVAPRNDVSSGETLRDGNKGAQVPLVSEKLSKTCNAVESLPEVNVPWNLPVKEEVTEDALQRCQAGAESVGIGSFEKEPVALHVRIAGADAKGSKHSQDSDIDEANSRPIKKLKSELDSDDHCDRLAGSLRQNNVKLDGAKASRQYPELSNVVSGEGKVVGTSTINTEANEAKVHDSSRNFSVGRPKTDKPNESAGSVPCTKREHSGPEGSLGARKRSSVLKPSSEMADESLKSNDTARNHSTALYQRKAGASVVRSSSTSGILSKSSEYMAATAQNSSVHSRQELSDSSQGTMIDNASADKVERAEKCGRPKKLVKESLRSGSMAKIPENNKSSNASDSKKPSSDSKDPSIHSSSNVPLGSNVASIHVSGECASPPQTEGASGMQNKSVASAVLGKAEKSGCNPSSKGHVASMPSSAPSNVPATLSDEELALLLHQELNSSPRVPRVPRMRHAGSLPQLAGPNATSTLMKRTSSSGGKDQGMASRRRTKDSPGEGSHASLEVYNEAKKMERKPISPDNNRSQDPTYCTDQFSRKEVDGGMAKNAQSMKKTNMNNSTSSSADANGHNLLTTRPSSRNATDDDPRMVGRQTNRTLPGLIAEIMSEGKRMTYEELCNAVLPHWPHLRKHNGERYAYSSHSQAVLDCLRNRSEWSRLVDRGPKTNASRKRRKLDADSMSIESEDNEDQRVKNSKDGGSKSFDSHQEEFPKGKRKARKRRLALQGRGSVRRRRRADVVSDDESESFSYSSEEDSMSSEEEIQGGGTSVVGSEVSASSEEVR